MNKTDKQKDPRQFWKDDGEKEERVGGGHEE